MQLTRRLALAGGALGVARWLIGSARADAALAGLLHEAVQKVMTDNGVSGASAALVIGGEPVWTESFGTTTAGAAPIDVHTIFSIQSTSKTFAATAVMLAVQRGLVNLDAPITRYLPDFAVNSRHEERPQEKMTVRHLLSMHSGFTHEAPIGNNFTDQPWTFDSHIRSIQDTWLRYPVGERFSYSNLGIDIAARILERASGMAYWDCLKSWLLVPLGMKDTTANPHEYATRSNRAIGHLPGYSKLPVRIPLLGSGGVYSSIADMTQYARFHLDQVRRRYIFVPGVRFGKRSTARSVLHHRYGQWCDEPVLWLRPEWQHDSGRWSNRDVHQLQYGGHDHSGYNDYRFCI